MIIDYICCYSEITSLLTHGPEKEGVDLKLAPETQKLNW
jgi:hypothetical protein